MTSTITQPMLFETTTKTATLSRDRIYRYELWRRWSLVSKRYVQFICTNPSTADETTDDPTVKKCVKYAHKWGFDALCITNLFAYRATDFTKAMAAPDPIGLGNDRHLVNIAEHAALIVCAWGLDGAHLNRATAVKRLLRRFDLHYLKITREQPHHPLYLPDAIRPSRWPRNLR